MSRPHTLAYTALRVFAAVGTVADVGEEFGETLGDRFAPADGVAVLIELFERALTLRRRRADTARVRMVLVATASYATLFAILLWQALRGQSLVQPDSATIAALMGWAILTALGTWFAATRRATTRNQAARGRAAIA